MNQTNITECLHNLFIKHAQVQILDPLSSAEKYITDFLKKQNYVSVFSEAIQQKIRRAVTPFWQERYISIAGEEVLQTVFGLVHRCKHRARAHIDDLYRVMKMGGAIEGSFWLCARLLEIKLIFILLIKQIIHTCSVFCISLFGRKHKFVLFIINYNILFIFLQYGE